MNIEQQRKAFEEAFKKEHSGVSFWLNTWDEEEQSYGHLTAGWAWKMWLAAQQQEGYVIVPVEPTERMLDCAYSSISDNLHYADLENIYRAMTQEAQE